MTRSAYIAAELASAETIYDRLIENSGLKDEIDLLSIDIDFNDYWVWKAVEIELEMLVIALRRICITSLKAF